MDTLLRLRRLLAVVLQIEEKDVGPDASLASLFDRYGGDSLDRVEFVMAVEEEFSDLEVPDEEAARWEEWTSTWTVQQLAEFIDRHRGPPTGR